MALPFFAITIFVSAFQLFLVQPMIGKMILPKLGGAPQVWNTCMVFFQSALLAGYAYTHTLSTRLTLRRQILLHGVLLFLPLLVLLPWGPFNVTEFRPTWGANPIPETLLLLIVIVGLPFFVVSTSAPLLQKWFAATGHPAAKDPYFLYAASNAGSMIGLAAYPFLLEWMLPLRDQAMFWTVGYVVFVAFVLVCAALAWQAPPSLQLAGAGIEPPPPEPPVPSAPSATQITEALPKPAAPKPTTAFTPKKRKGKPGPGKPLAVVAPKALEWVEPPPADEITNFRRFRWVMLAAVPSSLMLGTTTHMSVDLPPIPFLWIVPLALYLLSFILVFSRWPIPWTRGPHTLFAMAQPIFVLALAWILMFGLVTGQALGRAISFSLMAFFTTAMVCHGELARDRPGTRNLTEFYLWMSVGGMLGGMFNGLFAPVWFTGVVEYPLALVFACLLRPMGRSLAPVEKKTGVLLGGLLGFLLVLALTGTLLPPFTEPPTFLQLGLSLLAGGAGAVIGMFLQPTRKETNWTEDVLRSSFPSLEAWAQRTGQDMAKSFGKTVRPTSVFVLSYIVDIVLPLLVALLAFVLISNARDAESWGWLALRKQFNPLYKFLNNTFSFLAESYEFVGRVLVYGIPLVCCFFFANRGIRMGLALGSLLFITAMHEREGRTVLAAKRSFFGVLRVRLGADVPAFGVREPYGLFTNLTHGTTLHGQNYRHPSLARMATTYYHQYGPGGRVMEFYNWFGDDVAELNAAANLVVNTTKKRLEVGQKLEGNPYKSDARLPASLVGLGTAQVGVSNLPLVAMNGVWSEPPYATVGLGTGTMASSARPFQHMHFYEIDRFIREFSLPTDGSPPLFTYLKGARDRGVNLQVLMGDARLRMQQPYAPYVDADEITGTGKGGGPDNFYHMMVVDAFSSDAIPVHLITKESVEMYFTKLTPHGVLAVHISNRHLDLAPVVANVARHIIMEDPDQVESTITVEKGTPAGASITLPVLERAERKHVKTETRTLGLDAKGSLVVAADAKAVDKKYCTIFAQDNGWYFVEDAGSGTTLLNGVRVLMAMRLRAGDLVTVGGTDLRFTQKAKEVPLVSMRGTYSHEIFDYIGDSGQSWVMVTRSKKVLDELAKFAPKGYEERRRKLYTDPRPGGYGMPSEQYDRRIKESYWEHLTFDADGRLNPYGTQLMKEVTGPRRLGRPWTDDYSNLIGALR